MPNNPAPGAAGLHLVDGVALLRPEEQVFEAMMQGWRNSSWPATSLRHHRQPARGARVRRARRRVPVAVAAAADRRVARRPARGARAAPVDAARLRGRPGSAAT